MRRQTDFNSNNKNCNPVVKCKNSVKKITNRKIIIKFTDSTTNSITDL